MRIVVLDGYTLNPGDLSWADLEALGPSTVYDRTPSAETVSRAESSQIVLTNKTLLSADVIRQLPRLRYIGVLATGYNVVDIDAARAGRARDQRARIWHLLGFADGICPLAAPHAACGRARPLRVGGQLDPD